MMTSGGGAKYKGSIDCAVQIMKNEGFMSMMKCAGANVLRGVAGAGVLAGALAAQVCRDDLPFREGSRAVSGGKGGGAGLRIIRYGAALTCARHRDRKH